MNESTNSKSIKHLLELNLATFLISTSGPLGRYVELSVPVIIGCRSILAVFLLISFCKWRKISLYIEKEDRFVIAVGGILMGAHWITYFYALQWSSVAIGMLSLYTYPVLTSLIEPLFFKTKIKGIHVFLGAMVLVGLYVLISEFNMGEAKAHSSLSAVAIGVVSAFCYACRNVLMKTKVTRYHGSTLMSYQLLIISLGCLPFIIQSNGIAIAQNWMPIVALAICTTAIGHTLMLYSLKHFSVTTASIISSMQPIYGIILGILFLGEVPSIKTLIGGSIILATVVVESIRSYRK